MADQYAELFEGLEFSAPEGTVVARVKNGPQAEAGGRIVYVLWFYDKDGIPIEDNLTLVLSREAFERDKEGAYKREAVARVQRWLAGIRDGESVEFLA